jgi:hypothetical protein
LNKRSHDTAKHEERSGGRSRFGFH